MEVNNEDSQDLSLSRVQGSFTDLPIELKSYILGYLDINGLGFFAQTNKENNLLANDVIDANYDEVSVLLIKLRLKIVAAGKGLFLWSQRLNTIYAMGDNSIGHLGLGKPIQFYTPTRVQGLRGQIQGVVTSESMSLIFTDTGLFVAGKQKYDSLRHRRNCSLSFIEVKNSLPNIRRIFLRNKNIYILTDDGLYTQQPLLQDLDNPEYQFIKINYCGKAIRIFAFSTELATFMINNHLYRLVNIVDNSVLKQLELEEVWQYKFDAEQIVTGGYHLLILTTDNKLLVRGANTNGQLGLPENQHDNQLTEVSNEFGKIKKIYTASRWSFILTDQGLFACGMNAYGQLSFGNLGNNFLFTKIKGLPLNTSYPDDIEDVILNEEYTLIVTKKHGLWLAGKNPFNGAIEQEFITLKKEHLSPLNTLLEPEAKWVLQFFDRNEGFLIACKILSELVDDKILLNYKIIIDNECQTQSVFVFISNPTNLREIVHVYDILEQCGILKLHMDQKINRGTIYFVRDNPKAIDEEEKPCYSNKDLICLHQLHKQKGMMDPSEFETKWNKLQAQLHFKKKTDFNEHSHRENYLNEIDKFIRKNKIEEINNLIREISQTLTNEDKSVEEIFKDGIESLKKSRPNTFLSSILGIQTIKCYEKAIDFFGELLKQEETLSLGWTERM